MKWLCKIKHNWYRFPEPNPVGKSVKYCKRCGKIVVHRAGWWGSHWSDVISVDEDVAIYNYLGEKGKIK